MSHMSTAVCAALATLAKLVQGLSPLLASFDVCPCTQNSIAVNA